MIRTAMIAAAALVGLQGVAYAEGSADKGMVHFVKNCSSCHSIQQGSNTVGPNLHAVVGRTAGSVTGFAYSSELAKGDFSWNEPVLLDYLTSPTRGGGGDQLLQSVHMHFGGLSSREAEDLIAFLKALGTP